MRKIIIFFFISILFSTPVLGDTFDVRNQANHTVSKKLWFLNVSAGTTGKHSFGYDITYVTNKSFFTVGAIINNDFSFALLPGSDYEYDVHFLYGHGGRTYYFLFSISGGIGLAGGETEKVVFSPANYYSTINCNFGPVVSLPFQLQLFLRLTSVHGIGVKIHGNINTKESFVGIHLMVVIGNILD